MNCCYNYNCYSFFCLNHCCISVSFPCALRVCLLLDINIVCLCLYNIKILGHLLIDTCTHVRSCTRTHTLIAFGIVIEMFSVCMRVFDHHRDYHHRANNTFGKFRELICVSIVCLCECVCMWKVHCTAAAKLTAEKKNQQTVYTTFARELFHNSIDFEHWTCVQSVKQVTKRKQKEERKKERKRTK